MGKVNDLEKIGREVEVTTIDRSTRSKIELTMKKPADVPPKERKSDKQLEVPAHLTLEDHGDVAAQTMSEDYPMAEDGSAAHLESDAAESLMSAAMGSRGEVAASEKAGDVAAVTTPAHGVSANMPLLISTSTVGTGLAMYAIDIYLTTSQTLGRAVGWGIAIAASAVLAFGVMRLLPLLKRKGTGEEELILCPVCHEVVTETTMKCPSCGVKFKETSLRE
jgi:hypothetical protein